MSFEFKTRAQQRLEHLTSLKRPLTDAESELLRKSLHAVYEHNRRLTLMQHRAEELSLMDQVIAEANAPEVHRRERV